MGHNDDDSSESLSKLAWLWVIEALAGSKGITTSTLQGLIDAAPVVPNDFCKNTRELIAIKCLEKLYAQAVINLHASSSSTLDSRIRLDFSHTCEHVLLQVLHEVPLSKLKDAGAEILKWDLYPFILHKKAETVKCHLEQLKESILEGTLPLTNQLKARSGLFQRNRNNIVHVNDGEGDDHPGKGDGNSTYAENVVAKENLVSLIDDSQLSKECLPADKNLLSSKRSRVHSDDEHYTRYLCEKQVCTNDDFLRIKKRVKRYASKNFDSMNEKPVSQFGKKVSDSSTEKNLIISEKGGHHTDNNMEILRDGPLEDTHRRCSAANLCQSSSHNDESITPFNATLMPRHTFEGESSRQQQVKSNVALPCGTQRKTSGGKPLSKNETDLQLEDSNGFQQTVGVDKAEDDTGNRYRVEISGDTIAYQGEKMDLVMKKHVEQSNDMKCNEGDPQHTFGVEPCQDTSIDESNDAVHVEPIPTNDGNANKIQHVTNESEHKLNEPNGASLSASQKPVASDKAVVDTVNGCGADLSTDSESDGYRNEMNDLGSKKDAFLSSQHTFGRESLGMSESTEQRFCMKCNEAGQLLACKSTTCSLMVHRNCLDASAQVDEKGNFFCPFCAYSHAISEYLEAKKQASLARKELAIFINKGTRKQAAERVSEYDRAQYERNSRASLCK